MLVGARWCVYVEGATHRTSCGSTHAQYAYKAVYTTDYTLAQNRIAASAYCEHQLDIVEMKLEAS